MMIIQEVMTKTHFFYMWRELGTQDKSNICLWAVVESNYSKFMPLYTVLLRH